ncbi:hypothetical protein DL765_010850 [Monosporascus sp. GIB2]|nr:hypothetical protein DL765_010850 [Monosporascus sp. GIB2]
MRVEDLAQSAMDGCAICRLVLDLLREYCDDLEPRAKRDIVRVYATLRLTYPKDTLPALAGVARQMNKPGPRPEKYLAPSWWWACSGAGKMITFDEDGGPKSTSGSECSRELIKTVYATVLTAGSRPSGTDDFGEVAAGEIVLKAPAVTGLIRHVPRWPAPGKDDTEWGKRFYEERKGEKESRLKMPRSDTVGLDDTRLDDEKLLRFYPDYELYLPGRGQIENNTEVKVVKMASMDGRPSYYPGNAVCLVLREVSEASGASKIRTDWVGNVQRLDGRSGLV